MSLETERADLVRAVVEGVAHNLAWLLPHVEAFTGERIDEIAFVGGAARSARWCQVLADVLGRPVSPLAAPEGRRGPGDGAARTATARRDLPRRPRPRRLNRTATYQPDSRSTSSTRTVRSSSRPRTRRSSRSARPSQ